MAGLGVARKWLWRLAAFALALGLAAAKSDEVAVATVASQIVTLPVELRNDIRFQHSRLEQGLSQTRVSHIVQDDRGFLWFGTQHGLNRFDGRNYRVFKHEIGQPGSLSGVFVYALLKGHDGSLWVGSDQGLDVYDTRTETFRNIRIDADNPVVNHISEDERGALWLSTVQGLYRLDPATASVRRFTHDASPASLPSNDVKSSGLDRRGDFWVATGEGLEKFDRESGEVTLHVPLKESVREFYFHEDRDGVFWIVYGSGNGLAQFDRATNTLTRFALRGGEAGGSGLTGVYALLEDHEGRIWLGTMGQGLLRYNRERRLFEAYRHDRGDAETLAENRVIALFEDSQQNIWVGLHASPPNSFPAVKLPFERVLTPVSDPNAVGETLVNAVFTDSRGALWVGAGGALGRIEGGERRAVALPGGGPVEVLAIAEHPAGTLWVGTLGRGLFRLDLESGDVRNFRHEAGNPASLGSDIVTRIFVDRKGAMWLATWNGLDSFDPATGLAAHFKRNAQSAAEGYFSIAEDPSGDLWLGSTTGLYRFSPASGAFRGYTHKAGGPSALSNNTVNSVLVDSRGALWVGTQNGLNLFDRERGTFRSFGKTDGLPGDVVSCLLQERDGVLWMSGNNGISRFEIDSGSFSSYSVADGLPGNDLSGWNACHRANDGRMIFGGFAGATTFRPEEAASAESKPQLSITQVQFGGRPVAPGFGDRLEAPAGRNDIAIAYAALCFRNPEGVRYRYRLGGLDQGWREGGGEQRVVTYNGLTPGAYLFEVQARTGRSGWSEPAQALTLVVLPPWWQTWWFRAAALILAFSAIGLAYKLRLAQVGRQYAIRLEERVAERTRIARDLHDSLLQGFQGLVFQLQAARNLLPERPREAADLLDIALDRADAAVTEGRETVNALRAPEVQSLAERLASLRQDVETGSSPAPPLDVSVKGWPCDLPADIGNEIFLLAREAVRNAAQHARATRIEITLDFGGREVALRVRDDGLGFDVKAPADGRWGLVGMRERAARLGGRLTIESRAGAGTEVALLVATPPSARAAPARLAGERS